ncbi:MAG: hypothetical protein KDE50_30325 [Caldilineaceae bacterium]|nr:hypothetical protein [Caldilineaceae bacterium]MCB0144223.1 hypothetical protein [Caldilineaceae bacterium]MCB9150336.1 hypothetical protein [Caldilineaceae bacterium]MCB9157048.1 hypothetical protein [Caldilineaceae bacterium]
MMVTSLKKPITVDEAVNAVQDFVFNQLGNLIGLGQPLRVASGLQSMWLVPLVLTSPGYGIVGVVGGVMVDMEFGHIVGWTPLDEVRENAAKLTDAHENELESAFQLHRVYVSPSAS